MERWKEVQKQIQEFRSFLAPSFPAIDVTKGYDFAWSQEEYKSSRKELPYQCSGVYLLYDQAGALLYVGRAIYTFDKRIWTHKFDQLQHIDFICFDERHVAFALALEHFLIARLKPSGNTHGVGYEIPLPDKSPELGNV